MSVIRFATRENIDQQLWPWWLVNGIDFSSGPQLKCQTQPLLLKAKLMRYAYLYKDNSEITIKIPNNPIELEFRNLIVEQKIDGGLFVLFNAESNGVPGTIPVEEEAGNIIFIKPGHEIYRNGPIPIVEYLNPSRFSIGIFWQHRLLSDTISFHESLLTASLIVDSALNALKLGSTPAFERERDFFYEISNSIIKCYSFDELIDVLDSLSQSEEVATNVPFPNPIERFFLSIEDGFNHFQKSFLEGLETTEDGSQKSKLIYVFQNSHIYSLSDLQNQLKLILSDAKNMKEKISLLELMHDLVSENLKSFTAQERYLTSGELGDETEGNVLWIKRDLRYKKYGFTIERGRFTRVEKTLNDVLSLKKWIEAQIKKTTVLKVEMRILNSLREELKAMKKESNETDTTGGRNGYSDSAQIRIIINRIQRHFPNGNISRQKIDVWIWSNFFVENGFRYLNIRSN